MDLSRFFTAQEPRRKGEEKPVDAHMKRTVLIRRYSQVTSVFEIDAPSLGLANKLRRKRDLSSQLEEKENTLHLWLIPIEEFQRKQRTGPQNLFLQTAAPIPVPTGTDRPIKGFRLHSSSPVNTVCN